MNKYFFVFLSTLICSCFATAQQSPLRCGNELLENEESYENRLLERNAKIQNWLKEDQQTATAREEYVIPVVVHVLYTNEEERLPRQQILSQIAVLNEDFNARNVDTDLIPEEFRDLKADIGFTFCLAGKDPLGEDHDGIIYQPTAVDCIANTFDVKSFNNRAKLYYSDEGGSDSWDTDHYLNIWVGNTCGKYLGQTAPPNISFPGEDGVIIDYQYFGSGCTIYPFHLGRTATHEVGHYFGLNHIFSGADCDGDDGISDTPFQASSYSGCPTYPQVSCNSRDMFMNFMDYVDDNCMRLFTLEQKAWMVMTLEMEREGLLNYEDCKVKEPLAENETILFPNPAQHCIYIDLDSGITTAVDVRLFDASGHLVYESKSNGNFIRPISVESLPVGIYFLRLEYDGGEATKKVMVVH
ncbi:MAG: hypothetical protein ACI8YQ_003058 [Polaribacter sp.]|jgi:hypothetical protein